MCGVVLHCVCQLVVGCLKCFHACLCTFWFVRTYEIYSTIFDDTQIETRGERGTHYLSNSRILVNSYVYTDKKENLIFLIYKEIRDGAVAIAKSYITNGLLIYGEIFAHFLIY